MGSNEDKSIDILYISLKINLMLYRLEHFNTIAPKNIIRLYYVFSVADTYFNDQ